MPSCEGPPVDPTAWPSRRIAPSASAIDAGGSHGSVRFGTPGRARIAQSAASAISCSLAPAPRALAKSPVGMPCRRRPVARLRSRCRWRPGRRARAHPERASRPQRRQGECRDRARRPTGRTSPRGSRPALPRELIRDYHQRRAGPVFAQQQRGLGSLRPERRQAHAAQRGRLHAIRGASRRPAGLRGTARRQVCDLGRCDLADLLPEGLHRVRPYSTASNRFLMWCLWLGNTRGDYYADGSGSTICTFPRRSCGAFGSRQSIARRRTGSCARRMPSISAARRAADATSRLRTTLTEYRDALNHGSGHRPTRRDRGVRRSDGRAA